MIQLYDYYRSTACYRVRIALHYKQVPFETRVVHLINHGGEQHQADYLALNPQGLVPTLVTKAGLLTQSLAIIDYLDAVYKTPALYPEDPMQRAQVMQLALIVACDMHPLNNLRVLQRLKQSFQADEAETEAWYHHWLKLGFDAFEAHLQTLPRSQSVCFGDAISLADLCLIPQVYNANRFHFPLDNYPLIQQINHYCCTLPAFIQAHPEA